MAEIAETLEFSFWTASTCTFITQLNFILLLSSVEIEREEQKD